MCIFHFILSTTQWGKGYFYPCLVNEETEVQRVLHSLLLRGKNIGARTGYLKASLIAMKLKTCKKGWDCVSLPGPGCNVSSFICFKNGKPSGLEREEEAGGQAEVHRLIRASWQRAKCCNVQGHWTESFRSPTRNHREGPHAVSLASSPHRPGGTLHKLQGPQASDCRTYNLAARWDGL